MKVTWNFMVFLVFINKKTKSYGIKLTVLSYLLNKSN